MREEIRFENERKEKLKFAQQLRKNMTRSETMLWEMVRAHQFFNCKFRRQAPVGPYIVDFLCMAHHLVIEIDGGIHETRIEYDRERDKFLREQGYRILHIPSETVETDLYGALRLIEKAIFPHACSAKTSPSPPPPSQYEC
ncbi:MAG: DUF559 domain-containing protein [Candidatus Peregrinibacteria bacterium]